MSEAPLGLVMRQLRRLAPREDPTSDAQLLAQFCSRQDEAAFEALVRRHGPMVLGICRRVLRRTQDVEDAFQATFLVLVRRAGSLAQPELLGNFLYGVARRIALEARAHDHRRRARERQAIPMTQVDDTAQAAWNEVHALLDEELGQLPDKYRAPLVLCYLQGQTNQAAARSLGIAVGSMSWRLAKGRQLLRRRLRRRGVALSTGLLAAALSHGNAGACVSAPLLHATVQVGLQAASGISIGSTQVAALARTALRSLATAHSSLLGALVLTLVLAAGGGLAALGTRPPGVRADAPPPAPPVAAKARTDHYGDPLPSHALQRLGSVRWRHSGPVTSLAFLPGDKLLASGAFDGTIRLWQTSTGKEIRRVATGQGLIRHVALSPDGKMLASANNDSFVSLWDVDTSKELFRLGPFPSAIPEVAFAPDGQTLAGVFVGEKKIRLWEIPSGAQSSVIALPDTPFHAAFSPDGRTLAVGSDGPTIGLWDVATGNKVRRLPRPVGTLTAMAYSHDGKVLALAGKGDGAIVLWDLATHKERTRLPSHLITGVADVLAFAPDGRTLAAGFRSDSQSDDTIYLWDWVSGKELRRIKGACFGVDCLAFSADSQTLAAGGNDCAIRLWDTATGGPRHAGRPGHQARLLSLAYAPDGKTVATAGLDSMICLWDPVTGDLRRQIDAKGGWVLRLTFSPDGTLLASGHQGQTIRLWEVATGREVRRLTRYAGPRYGSLVFSPDGRTLAAPGSGRTSRLWDVATGQERQRFAEPGRFTLLRYLPDGKTLISVSWDGQVATNTIRLRDVTSGKELRHWETPQRIVETIAVSPDGKLLALGGVNESLRVWEIATGRERAELRAADEGWVSAVAFSPDSRTLAVALGSGPISLCETATGKERRRFDSGPNFAQVAFAPDGKTLACGGGDSTVLIWDRTYAGQFAANRGQAPRPGQAETLWEDLASMDAARADRAIWAFVTWPTDRSVPFLQQRLRPSTPPDRQQVDRLVANLDSEIFDVRERATRELEELDELAEPALRKGLQGHPGPDLRRRLEALLETLDGPVISPARVRALRAVEVLEQIGTTQAIEVLAQLAHGAPQARLAQEAKGSLQRLGQRTN
jgi:RNA polymerase sigma factor (sigma-70 family)